MFFTGIMCFVSYAFLGCGKATSPCGLFTFTGAPSNNRGIDMTLTFAFDPSLCKADSCGCDSIAYVQIIRAINLETGDFLYSNSEQRDRIVTGNPNQALNGWSVDRLEGKVYGYYGRNDNGTFASTLMPGSNISPALLRDSPWGWIDNTWFDAVSVPVCIDSNSKCINKLLGYYYWLFLIDKGNATAPFHEVGVTWHQDAFDAAVQKWNTLAPGAGKFAFPAFSRMP